MRNTSKNEKAFFALLRAGLWEKEAQLLPCGEVDYKEVMRLAEEQSVIGLITAGLEHVQDIKVPQDVLLQFIGKTIQLEQQNAAMNHFIGKLVNLLRKEEVYSILVKGQGIAQCYERPLWRSCGDVDLFLSGKDYQKAAAFIKPLASSVNEGSEYNQHLSMIIDSWVVELHGTLRGGLWRRIDRVLDDVQKDVFYDGKVRSWMNGETQVFLPGEDEDVIFVFAHILQHFFQEGVGLRQICDWCRFLWSYKDSIDLSLLEKRLHMMGVMTEWKAFAAMAVDFLGVPIEVIPFYSPKRIWNFKGRRVLAFIFTTGNFGKKRDLGYYNNVPFLFSKSISFIRHTQDAFHYFIIFPIDTCILWSKMFVGGN